MMELIENIGLSAGAFAASFALVQYRVKQLEKNLDKQEDAFNERLVGVSAAKKATVEKIRKEIDKVEEITHKRIDSMKTEQKEYEKKSNQEFKEINEKLANIGQFMAKMDGKLDTIIGKK